MLVYDEESGEYQKFVYVADDGEDQAQDEEASSSQDFNGLGQVMGFEHFLFSL